MVIVVMGVSGAGKTTVGRRLADELGWPFYDADDLHGPDSIALMRSGRPLTDAHRKPWLDTLARLIGDHVRKGRPMVLACSALSRAHRTVLLADVDSTDDVALVHLLADADTLADRLARRTGHFFPPDLLTSQLTTLEAPAADDGLPLLTIDAGLPVDEIVAVIRSTFHV